MKTTEFRFARKCNITGEPFNEGYCYADDMKYFKYKKDVIKHLRERGDDNFNDAGDEFLLDEAFGLEEYYYAEWKEIDEDGFYDFKGKYWALEDARSELIRASKNFITAVVDQEFTGAFNHMSRLEFMTNLLS